jgi:uncharacterized protein (UPF0297 family)
MWNLSDLYGYILKVEDYYKHKGTEKTRIMMEELPVTEGYPNIKQIFGYDLQNAKEFVKKVATVRTDLNRFTEDEQHVVEAIGYSLAAYRIR